MARLDTSPAEVETIRALLAETAPRLGALAAGAAPARLQRVPARKVWSPVEHLAHLRGCADVWGYTLVAMLAEDEPRLELMDPRRWAKAARYAALPFAGSLAAFASQRAALLNILNALPPEDWTRAADIGGRRHSVFSQARRLALHEQEHCQQVHTYLQAPVA
ncbi:MAG: DinB family protein [Anaerolineales bacterium]